MKTVVCAMLFGLLACIPQNEYVPSYYTGKSFDVDEHLANTDDR